MCEMVRCEVCVCVCEMVRCEVCVCVLDGKE